MSKENVSYFRGTMPRRSGLRLARRLRGNLGNLWNRPSILRDSDRGGTITLVGSQGQDYVTL
ncbi:hypothetical protein ACQQ67_08170 [Corynebacterium diphtheriae]